MPPLEVELVTLLEAALNSGKHHTLEGYLCEHSNLPGARMNLAVVNAFADAVGGIITQVEPPVESLQDLLDGWATDDALVNEPRVILPCAAVLAYGQAAVSRPDWWEDEIAKLRQAASDPRWRVREIVAMALQRMLAADWERTFAVMTAWAGDGDPLVVRAAAAGIAEPPLLNSPARGENAVSIQKKAVEQFASFEARRSEHVRTLRQALGFTVSVAVAAAPDVGFQLLEQLAASDDDDLRWIARENLKKNRLKPWADRVSAIESML